MKALAVAGLIACLSSVPALADCVAPNMVVQIPDGATASRDEMIAAQKVIVAIDAAVVEYSRCLEKSGHSIASDRMQNDAVDKLHRIADKYNAELRTFKKKSGG